MNMGGATGAVLKRSLASMAVLIGRAVNEVRQASTAERELFSVAALIADVEAAARLDASAAGCRLMVASVDPTLMVLANRAAIHAALANLLQNAFKFTHPHTDIDLSAVARDGQAMIEVGDHCGGLPAGDTERMFKPFTQRNENRSGLGLGLAIARHGVEADFGTLSARDLPGEGCIFTIALPLQRMS